MTELDFWESLDDYGKFQVEHPEAPDPFKVDDI